MRFDKDTIYTRADGTPYARPDREDFAPGIDGTIAHMRAMNAYRDQITDDANRAFDASFRNSVRGKPKR